MKNIFFLLSFAIISNLTAQSTVTIDSAIQRKILIEHNKERKLLNIPNLIWNEEIAAYAEEWALQLAEEDTAYITAVPIIMGKTSHGYPICRMIFLGEFPCGMKRKSISNTNPLETTGQKRDITPK
jgi:hypothetical protein